MEELSIGDVEDAISGLRAQMADPTGQSKEEYELLFETVAAMQSDLTVRKQNHLASMSNSGTL